MSSIKKRFLFFFVVILIVVAHDVHAISIKEKYPFERVIIWGHKLHSHTHSWIHWAFYRAFTHLGYKTYWLDNNDSIDHLDLRNTLFITEGQVDQKIPMQNDGTCRYILHNCKFDRYKELHAQNDCITLQVFTYDVLEREVQEIKPFIFTSIPGKIIYMPWATDLLPHEIDAQKRIATINRNAHTIYWVGTIASGTFGNTQEIGAFKKAAQQNNIIFRHMTGLSMEQNQKYIQNSYMAPAIVGTWQEKQGYIPCRIFKNISYGQMGITNSKAVADLFEHKVVYNSDTYQLFYDAQRKINSMNIQELYDLMDFVRDNHTYINRIEQILSFMNQVKPIIQ